MDPALHAMLTEWLDSDEPVKVAHARNRLATLEPGYVAPPAPPAPRIDPRVRLAVACPARQVKGCGCDGARCLRGKGDVDGGKITTLPNCLACVGQG